MLLYMLEDESREANWTGFATDWLFGELVMSSDSPEDNVLACGKLSDGNSYWIFVAKHHGRVRECRGVTDLQISIEASNLHTRRFEFVRF